MSSGAMYLKLYIIYSGTVVHIMNIPGTAAMYEKLKFRIFFFFFFFFFFQVQT